MADPDTYDTTIHQGIFPSSYTKEDLTYVLVLVMISTCVFFLRGSISWTIESCVFVVTLITIYAYYSLHNRLKLVAVMGGMIMLLFEIADRSRGIIQPGDTIWSLITSELLFSLHRIILPVLMWYTRR